MQYPMPPKPTKKGVKSRKAIPKKSMYTLERKPAIKGAKPKWGNPMYQAPRKPKRGRA